MMPEQRRPVLRLCFLARLAEIYRAAAKENAALGVDTEALESHLAKLCARGRTAHLQLALDDGDFVAHLARCGARVLDVLLYVEDLYLACACLAGNAAALSRLRVDSRSVLDRYLRRISAAPSFFEEVEQQLWNSVLVGTPEGPKLAGFAGRGPLGSWIGVSAQRIALMMLRHERVEARAREQVAAQRHLVAYDPEMTAIKARYRREFQAAFDAALAKLDERETTLYRLHLVDGIGTAEIAAAYRVHPVTIRRWLAAARKRLLEEAKRHLREHVPGSSDEFDSIVRLLISEIDVNISQLLLK
jgi:RNA polymerase sigma-70 factor (ECF subfamily)